MKTKYSFIVLILFVFANIQAQDIYLKMSCNYQMPASYQRSPDYISFTSFNPYYGSFSMGNPNISKFTLSEGINPGAVIGCSINELVSIEAGFSYFFNTRRNFDSWQFSGNPGSTSWQYQNYSFLPAVLFTHTINTSTLAIRIFTG